MTRFTIVHQEELAQVTDDLNLSWQARGLFLELLLAADYVTGMVPATSREQVRVWTGRSWSATANHLDELGKAGLIVESAAGIQVTVYPQVTDPRGEREDLRGKREQRPRTLAVSARLTCKNGTTSSNYKTTTDGHRFEPGEGWILEAPADHVCDDYCREGCRWDAASPEDRKVFGEDRRSRFAELRRSVTNDE